MVGKCERAETLLFPEKMELFLTFAPPVHNPWAERNREAASGRVGMSSQKTSKMDCHKSSFWCKSPVWVLYMLMVTCAVEIE